MRVLLISLFIGAVCTAPQGYDYQLQVGSGGNNDFTLEQYQLLQQYAQQQQQQQQLEQQLLQQQLQLQYQQQQPLQQPQQSIAIQESTPEEGATLAQTLTQTESGGYQFANQLVQQAQQLVQYEQQQEQPQQQQQQHQQQQLLQTDTVLSKEGYETAVPEVHTHTEPQVPEVVQQPPLHEESQPQSHVQANLQVPEVQVEAKHQQQHHQTQQQQIQYSQPPAVPQPQLQPQPHYEPTHHQQPQSVQYNKEFFYLTAPQDDFDQSQNVQNQLDQIKKNIRVVFIKAPEQNGLANAALQLAKQSQDAQTAIYVLTKQHDVNDLANKLQHIRGGGQSKPEVTFIKYKTPAEAEHAQRTIQAQYEALNGPNHFNHEGVSPTHSFIGSTGVDPRKSSSTHASAAAGEDVAATPGAKYLPSAAKH